MKKRNKKLLLSRETVRKLSHDELGNRVVGGSDAFCNLTTSGGIVSRSLVSRSLPVGDDNPDLNVGDLGDLLNSVIR